MKVVTTIFASAVLTWAQTGFIANYSSEAILNLLFVACMAANIMLFICIARSNTTLPVQKKVQAAHLFRILLVAASILCLLVLVAIAFLAPEIVWMRKLLLVSLVCMTLHMNWKYSILEDNYIKNGLTRTIIAEGDTTALDFALRRNSDSNRVFMSYRTTDARFVRFLSEQLIANGVPVWFDEYDITIDQKEKIAMQEEEFQRAIDHAVETSTKAICITHAGYANSPYCKSEASSLASRLPRDRILNITCPEHGQLYEDVPSISGEPVVHLGKDLAELTDNDRQMLCAAISRHVGSEFTLPKLEQQAPPMTRTFEWRHGVRYALDLGGWEEWQPDKLPFWLSIKQFLARQKGMDIVAGSFRREVEGRLMTLHVTAGIALQAGRRLFNASDVRPLYLVEVARRFDDYLTSGNLMPKDSGQLVGLHLLHTPDGSAHAAFTHFDMELSQWGRHYVIIVDNPVVDKMTRELSLRRLDKESLGTELEISMQIYVQNCTFKEFCRVAYLGDRVAASFQIL